MSSRHLVIANRSWHGHVTARINRHHRELETMHGLNTNPKPRRVNLNCTACGEPIQLNSIISSARRRTFGKYTCLPCVRRYRIHTDEEIATAEAKRNTLYSKRQGEEACQKQQQQQ